MMRLVTTELRKVLQNRFFLVVLAALLCVNLFLLWVVTSPMSGAYSSHAYKTMQINLQGMSMSEKQDFINDEMQRIEGFSIVDSVLRNEAYNNGKHDEYMRKQYAAEFAEFYDEYNANSFLKYNSTITNEYRFLQKIKAECDTVAGYDAFLTDIAKKATQLSGISVFAESADGYALKNIEKTALAYEGMNGIEIDYFPQMGVFTALDFELTDLIAVFAMLLIATVLVRAERDNGLLNLVRATPAGRLKTATAKLTALGGSLLVVLLLLYGVNLFYCASVYGLGDLSRSIQSVPALMRSTLKLSLMQYFGIFIFTKWLAAMVAGAFVMLCMLFARRAFSGYMGALGFLGLNLFMRSIIPATSNLNVLKYANLVSLLRTNELIGGYRNLYFFAQPVSIWVVEGITAIVCFALFVFAFYYFFCKAQLLSAKQINIKLPKIFKSKNTSTTVTNQETKKLLLMNGVAIFLVVFLGYQGYSAITTQSYINADEIYYSYYMKQVQGEITTEKIDKLKEIYNEFEPIFAIQNAYNRGEITVDAMSMMLSAYSSLQQKMNAFNRVWYLQRYLYENPRSQFVYEGGWLNLFDMNANGKNNRMDALLTALLSALCFAGLFAMEKQSGMERVISATPLGRTATVKAKLKCSAIACVVITVISSLPRFWVSIRDYGLVALFAPSYSIQQFSGMWELPLFFYIILFITARYLAIQMVASVTLALSYKTGNMFSALFLSSGTFALPILLSISGLENAKWLSVYPLFNAPAMFAKPSEAVAVMMIAFIFGFIIWRCNDYLYENFGKQSSRRG